MAHEAKFQCWQKVVNEGKDCLDMIRLGFDCHCSCSSFYRMYSLQEEQKKRPVFHFGLKVGGRDIAVNSTVWAGAEFRIQVTGVGLSTGEVKAARAKLVQYQMPCNVAMVEGLTGLTEGTPPKFSSLFYHAWDGVRVGKCGRTKICHCNDRCADVANWVVAGFMEVGSADVVVAGFMEVGAH